MGTIATPTPHDREALLTGRGGTSPSDSLRRLCRELARLPRVARATVATIRDLLVAGGLLLLVHWIGTRYWSGAAWIVVGAVAVVSVLRWFGAFRAVARGPDRDFLGRLDRRLGLDDQLTTWNAMHGRGGRGVGRSDPEFSDWLERSLSARLRAASLDDARAEAWPSWRPVKVTALACLLLLLLRLFVLFWPLPADGPVPLLDVAGGGGATASGGRGEGSGGAEPQPGTGPAAAPVEGQRPDGEDPPQDESPEDPKEEPEQPNDPPPDEPGDGQGGPEPELPPRRLLDLGVEESFLIPDFVGDGDEGEIETDAQATVERSDPGDGGRPPPPPAGSGGDGEERTEPPDPRTFERAAERALRARHVPPEERVVVRNWFEALRRMSAESAADRPPVPPARDPAPSDPRRGGGGNR